MDHFISITWLIHLNANLFVCIVGGLTAVMYTDTAQSVIIVIGAFLVMGLSK